jgi:hypothetical protein
MRWSVGIEGRGQVRALCRAFRDGLLPNSMTDPRYVNVATLKATRAA